MGKHRSNHDDNVYRTPTTYQARHAKKEETEAERIQRQTKEILKARHRLDRPTTE